MSCVICNEPRFWRLPFAHDPDVTRWRAETGDDVEYDWRLCRRCGNAYPSHQPNLAVLQRIWNASRSDDCLATDAKDTAWAYRRAISRAGAARSFRLFAPLAVRVLASLPIQANLPLGRDILFRQCVAGWPRLRAGKVQDVVEGGEYH